MEGDTKLCNINVALASAKETTSIKRGENEGVTSVNENVVRSFITQKAMVEDVISFDTKNILAQNKMAIIAYIQQQDNYKIVGAAMVSLK